MFLHPLRAMILKPSVHQSSEKAAQSQYAKYFVKLLGWYNNTTHLFIAMEYFSLGDLQSYI